MGIFARAASWLSRASAKQVSVAEARRVVGMRSALPALPLDSQFTRIGGGITPLQASNIIREADTGYIYRFVDLFNESRQKDLHMQSLLGTREAALTGLRWVMIPRSRDEEDFRRASFCESALKEAKGAGGESRGFSDMVSHLSSGITFGHATSETQWSYEAIEGIKGLVPVGFVNHSQRRFGFSQSTGRLGWRDEDSKYSASYSMDPVDLQAVFPDKFIQHQPRINGDVPSREGLGRILIWAALFRNWTISDWLKLAELAWKPWRIGKFSKDASTEEIDGLVDALDSLTTNGVGVFSDRADLRIEWPERGRGGKPGHLALCEYLGTEMSKGVLGQTLTVEPGERGARSLGEVHDRVRLDIRELDAISAAATINRDLIIPMSRMNFGTDRPAPLFAFVTDDTVDIGALARAIEAFVRAGLKIPQEWARDKAGIPEPEPGDEILYGKLFLEAEAGLIESAVQQWQGELIGQDEVDVDVDADMEDDEDSDDPDGAEDDGSGEPDGASEGDSNAR